MISWESWRQFHNRHRLRIWAGVLLFLLLWPAVPLIYDEVRQSSLDPRIPFQIYQKPVAPDFKTLKGWYLNHALSGYYDDERKVDVFFVVGTGFDGGKGWLASPEDKAVARHVSNVQLPNYAQAFAMSGNLYAPKYRQAGLYSHLTLREDARDARMSAYDDIKSAFFAFRAQRKGGNGIIIVGLEQGGFLAQKLLLDTLKSEPAFRQQLVAVYLIENAVSPDWLTQTGIPACSVAQQIGCVVTYRTYDMHSPDQILDQGYRSLMWVDDADVKSIGDQTWVCVNPITGTETDKSVPAAESKGATNATGLEWGAEPALMMRKISAQCVRGKLIVTRPNLTSLRPSNDWVGKRLVKPYNLFYGDLRDDAHNRWVNFRNRKVN